MGGDVDRGVEPAIYEYRLVEVALDGTRITHDSKRVDARYGATIESWAVGPNQPNPFANTTMLPISVPVDAMVDVTLYDVTGREIAQPVVHQHFAPGAHEISIDRNSAGIPTSLLARVTAYDIQTGSVLWQSEKPVMMSVLR